MPTIPPAKKITLGELWDELVRLREVHREEFSKWYEHANLVAVKDYTQIGWLIDRKLPEDNYQGEQPYTQEELNDMAKQIDSRPS